MSESSLLQYGATHLLTNEGTLFYLIGGPIVLIIIVALWIWLDLDWPSF